MIIFSRFNRRDILNGITQCDCFSVFKIFISYAYAHTCAPSVHANTKYLITLLESTA